MDWLDECVNSSDPSCAIIIAAVTGLLSKLTGGFIAWAFAALSIVLTIAALFVTLKNILESDLNALAKGALLLTADLLTIAGFVLAALFELGLVASIFLSVALTALFIAIHEGITSGARNLVIENSS